MDIQVQVGKNLKVLRDQKGWSQEELGFEASLDRTYISGIERGKKNPTVKSLAKIATALGVPPTRLLAEQG